MKPQIKYVVGDRRKKLHITPHIIMGDLELVATEPMRLADAQQLCRHLIADAHQLHEQYTRKYHEEVEPPRIETID